MAHINDVLDRHWEGLRRLHPGVLNIGISTKKVKGKDTGLPSITVYVARKLDRALLAPEQTAPSEIEGVAVDVVELAPPPGTFQVGETAISRLHPREQLRRLGLGPGQPPRVKKARRGKFAFSAARGHANWCSRAHPIQDQKSCGICLAFDYTGVWEALIAIAAGSDGPLDKLSEAHLFF